MVPSPLHVIANLGPKSSLVQLVVTLNHDNVLTRLSIDSALHRGLPQLPKLQEILIKYRLSLSFCVADLCAIYKCNILDPFGSLLSAIYLQGSKDSKYPKLDPRSDDKLELWIIGCANFGFSDSSSISCTTKNLMSHFYQLYFLEGLHKLSNDDIALCKQIFMALYSDDVLISIFLSTIQK